jgi:hypothetical protein
VRYSGRSRKKYPALPFGLLSLLTSINQLPTFAGFLFRLFFEPKDGGNTFLRNDCVLIPDFMVLIQNGVIRKRRFGLMKLSAKFEESISKSTPVNFNY